MLPLEEKLPLGLRLVEAQGLGERVRAPTLGLALMVPPAALPVATALRVGELVASVPTAENVSVTLALPEEVKVRTSLGLRRASGVKVGVALVVGQALGEPFRPSLPLGEREGVALPVMLAEVVRVARAVALAPLPLLCSDTLEQGE